MAKEFSCFQNISAIWQSSNITTCREKFKVIESFVVSLFVTESDISSSVDIARYQIFKYCGNSEIQLLPPTWDALIQCIHKAAYISGYIWGTTHIPARTEESATNWTLPFTGNRIKCQWVSYDHCLITQNLNKLYLKSVDVEKAVRRIANARK